MAHAFLSRWYCRVYCLLLYAYPSDFRRRYGEEMARVFRDRCRSVAHTQGLAGLFRFGIGSLADWLITALREGFAAISETPGPAGAAEPAFDGALSFYFVETRGPRPGALAQGGILSIAIFAAVSFALAHHGAGHRTFLPVGSHHPSRSHLLPAKTSAAPVDLASEVKANSYPDEVPISPYFRLMPVLRALDADHDNVISASEISNAPAALRTLDTNHDGKLTAEECGLRLPPRLATDSEFQTRARLAFMRIHPVLAALDGDHDGEISASEMERSPKSLRTLDKNRDGRLTVDEVLPH